MNQLEELGGGGEVDSEKMDIFRAVDRRLYMMSLC